MTAPWYFWLFFNFFILLMLALDLGIMHRHARVVRPKEALTWTIVWVVLALLFNHWIYLHSGAKPALEFLTGYLIEKSLSVDNVFVFLVIFSFFRVPAEYQHKVLFYGVLGALVMRAIFIFAGIALLNKFHWLIYIFGGFLIFTGISMAVHKERRPHPERNPVLKLLKRFLPMTADYRGGRFLIRENGRLFATPLLAVLLMIESTDLIFAIDSIPAILAITTDPFIVYTSNVFAILGLRSLYFALAGIMGFFEYFHYGLAFILVFVGIKMVFSGIYKLPPLVSLAVIAIALILSVAASIVARRKSNESAG